MIYRHVKSWGLGGVTVLIALCAPRDVWAMDDAGESYLVTHRTLMPHLEENLRYATTTARSCMHGIDFSILFPVLAHPSLAGCRLENARRQGPTTYHALRCDNANKTAGSATVTSHPAAIRGALEVTMGGKNMTFTQTVEAVRHGPCRAP